MGGCTRDGRETIRSVKEYSNDNQHGGWLPWRISRSQIWIGSRQYCHTGQHTMARNRSCRREPSLRSSHYTSSRRQLYARSLEEPSQGSDGVNRPSSQFADEYRRCTADSCECQLAEKHDTCTVLV